MPVGVQGGIFSPQGTMLINDTYFDESGNQRGQKEVIVKKKSSKSLIRPETPN
jgi:hypothetical protein